MSPASVTQGFPVCEVELTDCRSAGRTRESRPLPYTGALRVCAPVGSINLPHLVLLERSRNFGPAPKAFNNLSRLQRTHNV
jgi:hypothetical protein